MTDAPAPDPEIEVVYLGQRAGAKPGDSSALFITPGLLAKTARNQVDRISSFYPTKNVGRLTVGSVYRSTGTIDEAGRVTTLRILDCQFVRRLDKEQVAEWELLDEAARLQVRSESQARKLKASPVTNDELAGLRRLYLATPASLRPALELAILRAIRGAA